MLLLARSPHKEGRGDGAAREELWGSQFLNAFLETGIQIRRPDAETPNQILVTRHTKSAASLKPLTLTFHLDGDGDEPPYRIEVEDYVSPQTATHVEADETGKGVKIISLKKCKA